jgi:hypothetical protein
MPIYRFGLAEQRQRWKPELCAGERLAAFGLTEADGGSDIPGGMRTTVRLGAGEWVVDGSKAFITNSGTSITSPVTALAITGRDDRGGKEISSIIIPNGTAGFVPGPEYSKVGWYAPDTRELSFTGCRVPGRTSSPRWPPAWPRAASTSASPAPGSARRPAAGWSSTRRFSSPSRTWGRGCTRPWTMPGPPPRPSAGSSAGPGECPRG